MIFNLVQVNYASLFLVLVTTYFLLTDRSCNRPAKKHFLCVLAGVFLILISNIKVESEDIPGLFGTSWIYYTVKICLFPIVVLGLISILTHDSYKKFSRILTYVAACNIFLCILFVSVGVCSGFEVHKQLLNEAFSFVSYFIDITFLIIFMGVAHFDSRKYDDKEHSIVIIITVSCLVTATVEIFFDYENIMNNCFAIAVCVYYYFWVAEAYRKDALTGLLNRHDMNYDLAKIQNKEYYFCIIDIDNFKNINDKYGHEAGDDALVKVVSISEKHLIKRAKMYRYGGDEFAIVCTDSNLSEIEDMFSEINKDLAKENFRISYGISFHEKDANCQDCIVLADKHMYENKRQIKSEDIWDDMTGLFNLRGFIDELELLKREALARHDKICLLSVDVDCLGNINKAYGYSEGNMIIVSIAGIIKSALASKEFAGHLGSDEFVIGFRVPSEDDDYMHQYIEKIKMSVSNCPSFDGKDYTIEINAVTYLFDPEQPASLETQINNALSKKENEKESKRKSASVDSYMEKGYDKEEEAYVLDIIEKNKLIYHWQPIISARDGEIVAYEALMRTACEPSVSPFAILRYAEINNRLYEIEQKTFDNILGKMSVEGFIPADKRVFINSIPGYSLTDEDYENIVVKYSDILERVAIEITEQSELSDSDLEVIRRRQKEEGYMIAIDDFGSGNANTFSLMRIKPDYIKLDRLLIEGIDHNTKKQYFVNSMINFGRENGMKVIAEGVQNEAELKMLIRLQVDYIQGFYIGKPTEIPIKAIDEDIRKIIVSENIRGVIEGNRKIYVASKNWEVSLVQLALQEYTGITVSASKISVVGNSDYIADMTIKIKDGIETRMFLRDVRLNSVDEQPCIDIGEGCDVTLFIEGECSLNHKGIRVPEGSRLTIMGTGNISLTTAARDSYAIGGDSRESIGTIILKNSGTTKIKVDGDTCIGIGGGYYKSGEGIKILSGVVDMSVGGIDAVGIGVFHGDIPLELSDISGKMEFRVNSGVMIGSLFGKQSTRVSNFGLTMRGSGNKIVAIGSTEASSGDISLDRGELDIHLTGQELFLLGTKAGNPVVSLQHIRTLLKGEGNMVVALGTYEKDAKINIFQCTSQIRVNAADAVPIGAEEENFVVEGSKPELYINQ